MAYERECDHIIGKIKSKVENIEGPEGIWNLCDMLVKRRKDIDRKYDYRYSQLPLVFGVLLREGWLNLEDLDGLSQDKLNTISNISNL